MISKGIRNSVSNVPINIVKACPIRTLAELQVKNLGRTSAIHIML